MYIAVAVAVGVGVLPGWLVGTAVLVGWAVGGVAGVLVGSEAQFSRKLATYWAVCPMERALSAVVLLPVGAPL